MIKVMVFGTFDIFHKGHENFLKQARKYGDYLIIVIARDKTVKQIKEKLPQNNEQERMLAVRKNSLADKVILGNLKDKYKVIKEYRPNVICLGYDQVAFTKKLKNKLNGFDLSQTQIIKLKPYKEKKYKSSKFKN